jgi:5-methyltetrahydropteroyltriglutamate--homocysteine methyltransferase
MMKARSQHEGVDEQAFDRRVDAAVGDAVRKQVECGVDVVSDGEQGKDSFYAYAGVRLAGFEPRDAGPTASRPWPREINAFPEFYRDYYFGRRSKGRIGADMTLVCTGPVSYQGHAQVQKDIKRLKTAAQAAGAMEAFMPSTVPQGLGRNEYYKTEEEYALAVAEAMREEYLAIVDAGLVLQVDDPYLTSFFADEASPEDQRRRAEAYVEVLNHALRDVPPEMVRFHTCYGINEGPRVYEAGLSDIIEYVLEIDAGSYSFEAANPRHEHEYHLFERVKVPDGKVLCPGVITHASNIVEHPEWIAERLIRFANLVGRENVMAGADCGFSSQALYKTEVHSTVVWEKFKAMRQGADIATARLWK